MHNILFVKLVSLTWIWVLEVRYPCTEASVTLIWYSALSLNFSYMIDRRALHRGY